MAPTFSGLPPDHSEALDSDKSLCLALVIVIVIVMLHHYEPEIRCVHVYLYS